MIDKQHPEEQVPADFIEKCVNEAKTHTPSWFFDHTSARNGAEAAYRKLTETKAAPVLRWVKASEVDFDMILRPVLAKRSDDEAVMGRGAFQKSDGTFFWREQGFVPVLKKDHNKLLLLEEIIVPEADNLKK